MFDLFMRYCRMTNCKATMHLTPAQCKDNDLTVSECTFIYDHFDTLKAEHAALGGTLTTISTKIDNLGNSFEGADYLTASDIQPLFDTQYDEKII